MASAEPEVGLDSIQIPLHYEREEPLQFFIETHMLKWTVAEVKRNLINSGKLSFVREQPEYLDIVLAFRRGKGKGHHHDEELVLKDEDLLALYWDELCLGHMMMLKARRKTFRNDLAYFRRRSDEILTQNKTLITAAFVAAATVVSGWTIYIRN